MQTSSQKALKVISIVVIVLAVLGTVLGCVSLFTGGVTMAASGEALSQQTAPVEEAELAAGFGLIVFMAGAVLVLGGIIDIVVGILGLGVAKDGRRINLYIGLCIAGLVLGIIGIVSSIFEDIFLITDLLSPITIGAALYLAFNIKKSLAND